MKLGRTGLAIAIAASGDVAACSVFTQWDDFSRGVTNSDGGAIATRDGDGDTDTNADAGDAQDTGATPFRCADLDGSVIVCDEFERTLLNGENTWSSANAAPTGILTIEPREAGSGRALRVQVPARDGGGSAEMYLHRASTTPHAVVTLAFDLALLSPAPQRGRQLMVIRFDGANGESNRVYLSFDDGVLKVVQQSIAGGTSAQEIAPAPERGVFHRYEIVVDTQARIHSVRIDGTPGASIALSSSFRAAPVELSAGVRFGTLPTDEIEVLIDNVVATGSP